MKRVAYILIAVCILGIGAYLVTRSAGTDGEAANDIEVASADEPPAPTRTHQVRSPAAAGKFYPGHRETLRQTVDSYLQKAGDVSPSGSVIAVIAPHAGYRFSGAVAGHAFAAVSDNSYETVVVVGPSHGARFAGAAVPQTDHWRTPLGQIPINRALVENLLAADDRFTADDSVMAREHSIEVELPFLQRALDDFKLVPIQIFDKSPQNLAAIAAAVYDAIADKDALIVASTDMSHYPAQKDARRVDQRTLQLIKDWKITDLIDREDELPRSDIANLHCGLCGIGAVAVTMSVAAKLGANAVDVLKYANSGDVPQGRKARCVGYCAVAFSKVKDTPQPEVQLLMNNNEENEQQAQEMTYEEGELSREQQEYVLDLARRAINQWVKNGERVEPQRREGILGKKRAVFVTLNEDGQLRGCIGSLEARKPLVDAIVGRAIAAATEDPRFPPVEERELPLLDVHVSVLTPMEKIDDASEIEIGTHGVVVKQGMRSGVFLPEVAPDQGWDVETTLNNLCSHKAGLPADAWKKDAELYVFTTQSFGDPEEG